MDKIYGQSTSVRTEEKQIETKRSREKLRDYIFYEENISYPKRLININRILAKF